MAFKPLRTKIKIPKVKIGTGLTPGNNIKNKLSGPKPPVEFKKTMLSGSLGGPKPPKGPPKGY